ncbi:MAG TPA: right-handed parallel beta-helix repeat-containing protein [Bacteroidales bacterium]|nr:right-handed parallel beta-helix repeat-containing protein [Bacteroidales bacterium]
MHRLFTLCFIIITVMLAGCSRHTAKTVNYYFDPVAGDDSLNAGTSQEKPFRSLSMINKLTLKPGDSVLLKSGAVFTEPMFINCSGDSGKPVVFGKYGGNEKPRIRLDGTVNQAVHAYNSEHIVIRDLEVSNIGPEPVSRLTGVLVELKHYGTAQDITLDNLFVHDVLGSAATDSTGGGVGIQIRNYIDGVEDSVLSRFDGLLIQNCLVKDCVRDGILMWGNWIRSKWFPSLNVVIRNNTLDGIPGHGIVLVGCLKPLVEYNVMKNCPDIMPHDAGSDGIWPWGCDSALIQFNIVSDVSAHQDGFGFDSDYNCKGSSLQYNLSYNNAGGFLLICNPGGWPPDWCIGNSGTVIRYNVSINDGIRTQKVDVHNQQYFSPVINVTGPTENTLIEKNLFFVMKKEDRNTDRTLVHFTDWHGYSDSTLFRNNYIYSEESNTAWKPTKSTNSKAESNIYSGILAGDLNGFSQENEQSGSKLWYDRSDKNWDILLNFLKDKTIVLNGENKHVWDILGIEDQTN